MIRCILTDIEGTTSSISFVKEVLFPYAVSHMHDFLTEQWENPDVQVQIEAIATEVGSPVSTPAQASAILQAWIAQDLKITPLKALQGMIWQAGYESGAYKAHMYPDAPLQLKQWKASGLSLYVYSSGSIAAQKLFFGYSEAGDLTALFSGFFDTTSGGKRDVASYRTISTSIGVPAKEILFLSDIIEELDAARESGMRTVWLDRENTLAPCSHPRAQSFSEICPEQI